ncbi:hypothetical protein I6N98_00980 [Spongiibacter nanhainus]|uniref:Secreted protein n=1 Tax=Spongiibacter nanhainus TaxID=2794344 RepID=A0A7T4R126_9GAMM|nr:hypothetical protein [Spongiibacter nanhainus]QQD18481.1 hypothetical protein I6N98_00980 [Spongiibacter nanhainus]
MTGIFNRSILLLLAGAVVSACTPTDTELGHRQTNMPVDKAQCQAALPMQCDTERHLMKAQQFCLLPDAERPSATLRSDDVAELLDAMLAATCEPLANHHTIEALAQRLDELPISDSERALLALVKRQQQALSSQRARIDNLEAQLESTIEGIGEIESELHQNGGQQP